MDFLNQAISTVKSKVDQYRGTELERKVKQVTSTEQWHAPNSVKTEIAEATYDYQGFTEVMQLVWTRLNQPPNMYVVIVKTLALLEHLIRVGNPRIVDNSRDHIYQLRSLQDFEYHDGERDRGTGVRESAKRIVELLNDEAELKRIREEFEANREKYVAISNSGSVSKYGGMGSGSGGSSKYSGMGSTSSRYDGFGAGGSAGSTTGGSKYDGFGSGGSKYEGVGSGSYGGYGNDEYSNPPSANSSWKEDKFTEPHTTAKKATPVTAAVPVRAATKPATKAVVKPVAPPAADDFGEDAFTSAATVSAAPTAGNDFDFDADFDSAATSAAAKPAATPAPVASFDVFSSAPVAADPFTAMASVAPVSAAAADPFASSDPFTAFASAAPAPAAAPTFDVFSFDAAPTPVAAPAQPAPSAAVDFFGDFSSAPTAAPAPAPAASQSNTATKVEVKVKTDDLWGLADLDLSEDKKEEKKPATTYSNVNLNMWSAPTNADPFSNLVGGGNAPAPMLPPMQQNGMNMGMQQNGMNMGGMGMNMGANMGYNMQNGMQGYGMPSQQQPQNNFW